MLVHLPTRKYPYYAFVTDEFTLAREPKLKVSGKLTAVTLDYRYKAGIYGFTSIEKRDSFVSSANRANPTGLEVAHVVGVDAEPID
jgi:hypothetical protein